MNRTPPAEIRRALRAEVGFCCPVTDCGSPYLTWHHFDPPWSERHHHDADGMIALCLQHHEQADAGTFTEEQLRDLKTAGCHDAPAGRFNWMRDELIGFIGGNFYVDVAVAVQVGRHRVVWFNRDDANRLLLNLDLPSESGENRLRMEDNFWIETGSPVDLECPPSGTRVRASYENGDNIAVRFREVASPDEFVERYPQDEVLNKHLVEYVRQHPNDPMIAALAGRNDPASATYGDVAVRMMVSSFPVAVVEIELRIAGTSVDLRRSGTPVGGEKRVGAWIADSPLGYVVRAPADHPWAGMSDFESSLRPDT
jgi:hypothetical protein